MNLTVTFTRGGLGLEPLVITRNPSDGALYLPEDGVGEVGWDYRRTYAPDSAWVPGKMLLAAVREASTLPLRIYATHATSAGLQAARQLLEAAATQWAYDVTVDADGVAETYHCEPAIPQWGPKDSGMARARLDACRLVIPVNP